MVGVQFKMELATTNETETIFRKSYTPEELTSIVGASRTDEFIQPTIIAGICTAMRRGDCRLLEWTKVDLQVRFISVETAKTGQIVSIPILPLLAEVLGARLKKRKANEKNVFAEQAAMYLKAPDDITWRVQQVQVTTGFRDHENDESKLIVNDAGQKIDTPSVTL